MSLTDLYQIGASATRAYQGALGAIATNIANADTANYNRRNIQVQESAASTATGIYQKPGYGFAGVEIGSVVRANDPYLDQAARRTGNALADVNQRSRWMTDIQTALNDGPLGVGQRMSGMFASIERLASNPTDTTLRTDVLFSMEQVNTAFAQSRTDLVAIKDGIGNSATNEVASLNDAVSQLASANEGLRRASVGSAAQVQLLDQRDQALGEISKRLDVTISYDGKGIADVKYQGNSLVVSNEPLQFAVTQATDGTLNFTLDGNAVATPANGALAGLAKSATVTKTRIDQLDTLAQQYVDDINDWHEAGYTAAGNPGQPILSIGADASTIKVEISDPADIAGASGAPPSSVMNGNLVAAGQLRGNAGSMENKWTQIISEQGNIANATVTEQTAASTRDQQAQEARGDVSGVNLDREAADMLRLQQAYQAGARVIQVARELTDAIFAIF
jgi:flagellar hook-associated protein 1 FlgK